MSLSLMLVCCEKALRLVQMNVLLEFLPLEFVVLLIEHIEQRDLKRRMVRRCTACWHCLF